MDDEIGLINMNAREYDPVLGRFLTPDTFVQYPQNTQGFNRYSYVHNNPLSYTDPSGHFLGSIFREVARAVKIVVNAVKDVVSSQVGRLVIAAVAYAYGLPLDFGITNALGLTGNAIASGAIGGGVLGFISTGDIKGAFNGAISGAVFGGVGDLGLVGAQKVAAHALAGGITSSLMGGDFKSGALAAGFAQFAGARIGGGAIERGIMRAVVGGVAAEIGGGKFANGAMTATYAYLFNELGHGRKYGERYTNDDGYEVYRTKEWKYPQLSEGPLEDWQVRAEVPTSVKVRIPGTDTKVGLDVDMQLISRQHGQFEVRSEVAVERYGFSGEPTAREWTMGGTSPPRPIGNVTGVEWGIQPCGYGVCGAPSFTWGP